MSDRIETGTFCIAATLTKGNLIIKNWLLEEHPNLYPMGRNGMHRYNNQDHSMMTAVKSVRNYVLNEKNNIWGINVDDGYHEEGVVERKIPTQNQ